jgi:hypothetical protein
VVIILDELEYAKTLIEDKQYPKLKNLVIIAKYLKYNGDKPAVIKNKLISYCKENALNWNETMGEWKIYTAIKETKKHKLRIPISIPITKREIENIRLVNNYELEKFLFVLLVYAKILKYNDTRIKPRKKPQTLGFLYVNEKVTKLFKEAHLNVRKDIRQKYLQELYSLGYIDQTNRGSFVVKYGCDESDMELTIIDYNNIVLYYQRLCGEKIAGCECGKLFLKKTSRHSLCPICWKKKRLKEKAEYTRNYEK